MEKSSFKETIQTIKELYENNKIIRFRKYWAPYIKDNPILRGKVVGYEERSGWIIVRIINPQKSYTGWQYNPDNESEAVKMMFFDGFKLRQSFRFWFIQYSQIIKHNKH